MNINVTKMSSRRQIAIPFNIKGKLEAKDELIIIKNDKGLSINLFKIY